MSTFESSPELDIREQIARIDLALAQHDRTRQEIRYAPILAMISGMTAGAAIFGAAAILLKLLGS